MALWYCAPWSQACPFTWNGSMLCQNASSNFAYVTLRGSYTTWTDSKWPVAPVVTSSYDGPTVLPPMKPTVMDTTPSSTSKGCSMDQKHPPANVAVSSGAGAAGAVSQRAVINRMFIGLKIRSHERHRILTTPRRGPSLRPHARRPAPPRQRSPLRGIAAGDRPGPPPRSALVALQPAQG